MRQHQIMYKTLVTCYEKDIGKAVIECLVCEQPGGPTHCYKMTILSHFQVAKDYLYASLKTIYQPKLSNLYSI